MHRKDRVSAFRTALLITRADPGTARQKRNVAYLQPIVGACFALWMHIVLICIRSEVIITMSCDGVLRVPTDGLEGVSDSTADNTDS